MLFDLWHIIPNNLYLYLLCKSGMIFWAVRHGTQICNYFTKQVTKSRKGKRLTGLYSKAFGSHFRLFPVFFILISWNFVMLFSYVFSTFICLRIFICCYYWGVYVSVTALLRILLIFKMFINTFEKIEACAIISRHSKPQKNCLGFWALGFNSVCPFNVSWTLNTDEKRAGCSDMDVKHLLAAV